MQNFSIRITADQNEKLKLLSVGSGKSKADHIRFAIESYLDASPAALPHVRLPQRVLEIIEFTLSSLDRLVTDKLGENKRNEIIDEVSENLDKHHG